VKYKGVEQNSKNKKCTHEQRKAVQVKNNLSHELLLMSNDQFVKGKLIAPSLN